MKIKKSTRLYIMIALISVLSSVSTIYVVEYLRTPPTAAYAAIGDIRDHDMLFSIMNDVDRINNNVKKIYENTDKLLRIIDENMLTSSELLRERNAQQKTRNEIEHIDKLLAKINDKIK